MPSPRVEVSRPLFLGLILLCALSLLALAFLLGRESKRESAAPETRIVEAPPPPAVREQPDLRGSQAEEPPPVRTPPPQAAPPPELPPQAPQPQATRPPAPPARTPSGTRTPETPAVDPAAQERVRAYLQAMDASVGAAATWDNPEALAQAALSQGAEGDPEGFDRLLRANREALQRMRAVAPPPAAARHHALAVQVMERGIGMLERLRAATLSHDTAPLAALATEGQELQGRIAELTETERRLRSEHGLP